MISDFISQVRTRGLARTNRYEVIVPFPTLNPNYDTSRLVSIFCESVNLPGINIASQPVRVFGESREMPYERMFDPVTLTFYIDYDHEVKTAWEQWFHSIMNQTSRTMTYYDSYIKPVVIKVIKEDQVYQSGNGLWTPKETAPYVVTLHEAYPKSLSAIQMSADSREIMKMQVTLQYRYWTSNISEKTNNRSTSAFSESTQNQDPAQINTGSGYGDLNPIIPSILVGNRK